MFCPLFAIENLGKENQDKDAWEKLKWSESMRFDPKELAVDVLPEKSSEKIVSNGLISSLNHDHYHLNTSFWKLC